MGVRDERLVWAQSAGRCALCRCELTPIDPSGRTTGPIGHIAHIVAASPKGPRGESVWTSEQRGRHTNLILLCPNHHSEVDDNPARYPVEELFRLKIEHLEWVRLGQAAAPTTTVPLAASDADVQALITDWLEQAAPKDQLVRFPQIDHLLALAPGSAQRYLPTLAATHCFSVEPVGPTTAWLRHQAPMVSFAAGPRRESFDDY